MSSIFISIDAHDSGAHEQNRGLPRVCARIQRANAEFKQLGILSTASVTMSRLLTNHASLTEFLRELDFEAVTFSYPLQHLESSFLGYADSKLLDFSPAELVEAFEAVKDMKRTFTVVNPVASIEDMQRLVRGEPQRFRCLAGDKYFYLDWELRIWRCHHWAHPFGNILDFEDIPRMRDDCQRCMIDCMRDPSVLQHVAVAMRDAVDHAKAGRVGRAVRTLFTRNTLTSIQAVFDQARWIARL
jgi:MoaA/NifB/PqqE/SkfB family radical SAM enzyme